MKVYKEYTFRWVTTCALLAITGRFTIISCAPIYNYGKYSIKRKLFEPKFQDYDYYYDDSTSRQLQIDTSVDASFTEKVSVAIVTLGLIGLSYVSSKSEVADLQLQINSLRSTLESTQTQLYTLQNSVSSLSTTVSTISSSSASSAVLESTCNTLKSITSITGTVSTTRDIQNYLRTLILVGDPVCS